jgi:hypothetical protein
MPWLFPYIALAIWAEWYGAALGAAPRSQCADHFPDTRKMVKGAEIIEFPRGKRSP